MNAETRSKVFISYGHDEEAITNVANFVENLGLKATVLDEQPDNGLTVIENLEKYADDTEFAIAVLTPDDIGALKDEADHQLNPRERQNVILELGYFLKALEGQQICILYKGNVELPSDLQGILYVPMDDTGEWRQKVIREMLEAKILIDKNKV